MWTQHFKPTESECQDEELYNILEACALTQSGVNLLFLSEIMKYICVYEI